MNRGRSARDCRCRAVPTVMLAALPLEVRPFLRQQPGPAPAGTGSARPGNLGWGRGGGSWPSPGWGRGRSRAAGAGWWLSGGRKFSSPWGSAGALLPGAGPGDLVLGESFWRYDPETGGSARGGGPGPAPAPAGAGPAPWTAAGLPAVTGSFVTTPGIIHKGRQGEPLRQPDAPGAGPGDRGRGRSGRRGRGSLSWPCGSSPMPPARRFPIF